MKLDKKIKKKLLETKEQKDKLIIEQEIVRSRFMMIFESEDNMNGLKVEFPIIVTPGIVDKLIKKNTDNGAWTAMYS